MSSNKQPPLLSKCKSYQDYIKKINIWCKITSIPKKDQGGAILLTLENEAEDKVLELDENDILCDQGVANIIKQLDKIYKKNETLEKFEALDSFETYRRQSEESINDFIIEFDKRLNRTKKLGTEMSNDLLAYRMIKSANLSEQDERLVKATCKLDYAEVKDKLKSMFGDAVSSKSSSDFLGNIKTEDVFDSVHDSHTTGENSTLFTRGKYRGKSRGSSRGFSRGNRGNKSQSSRSDSARNDSSEPQSESNIDSKNPLNDDGSFTQCVICKSIYHWAPKCPHRDSSKNDATCLSNESATLMSEHVVLHAYNNTHNTNTLNNLMAETWNTAVLDCGATKTVAGRSWVDHYVMCLSDDDKKLVQVRKTNTAFRFGDGNQVISDMNVTFPAILGNRSISISTDVIEKDIPLLLSRESMKKANMKLDFSKDIANMCGEDILLTSTKSGHYTVPLTKSTKVLRAFENNTLGNFTLTVTDDTDVHKTAVKLHSQFAHPTSARLIKLLESAGEKWCKNEALKNAIKEVTDSCDTCIRFKKTPPRPVVGLPLATQVNECVGMDLKFHLGNIILHLVDHVSRLSAGCRIPSKQPEVVIKGIFKSWIQHRGSPQKFLTDNGGEFMNEQFLNMCEKMNITVLTTAAESPWSNGLVERHNAVLEEMLNKVLDETKCDYDTALAWCFHAKNSLMNVDGFSPFQIATGCNPTMPVAFSDRPTTYGESSSDIVRMNLNAQQNARKAFIELENSDKIRRALAHNTRHFNDIKYITGDSVFYKRKDSKEWKGPGKVIGQDGQQVLVKHGSTYVRVHPCRLALKNSELSMPSDSSKNASTVTNVDPVTSSSTPTNNIHSVCDDDTDDECEVLDNASMQNDILQDSSHLSNTDVSCSTQADSCQSNDSELVHSNVENLNIKSSNSSSALKKGSTVSVKLPNSDNWSDVKLTSRAGKAGGKYKMCWNTVDTISGAEGYIDFEDMEWKISDPCTKNSHSVSTSNEEILVNETVKNICNDKIKIAKDNELDNWKSNDVYREVNDQGQDTVSVRWVITAKVVDQNVTCKARLCARGFEEEQPFRKDSPTGSREGLRLTLSVLASKGWELNSLDIKSAFLQGKEIDRVVHIKPPPEANTNKLWQLKKCVYGLADAPRKWHIKLKEELLKSGAIQSKYDEGLFYVRKDNQLIGILSCHVDDILWGGTPIFKKIIIGHICKVFLISNNDSRAFQHLGVHLKQDSDGSITIDQKSYAQSLNAIMVSSSDTSDKNRLLTESEVSKLRCAIGQLNWLACITRPDIAFDVSVASSKIKKATVEDILNVNKIIAKVKSNECSIRFPKLNLNSIKMISYSDASFNNLQNAGSQGGHIVFLADDKNKCAPIEWKSNRIKRVVRSALAAESLACADCVDTVVYWSGAMSEILNQPCHLPESIIDSKQLYDNLRSTKAVSDRLLRLDINLIQENIQRNNIKVTWTKTEKNLSDILTKSGVCSRPILSTIHGGKF